MGSKFIVKEHKTSIFYAVVRQARSGEAYRTNKNSLSKNESRKHQNKTQVSSSRNLLESIHSLFHISISAGSLVTPTIFCAFKTKFPFIDSFIYFLQSVGEGDVIFQRKLMLDIDILMDLKIVMCNIFVIFIWLNNFEA